MKVIGTLLLLAAIACLIADIVVGVRAEYDYEAKNHELLVSRR